MTRGGDIEAMERRQKKRTEVKIQLFIKGFKCSPEKITQLLGISPTETWVKGEPIRGARSAVYKFNGWNLESSTAETTSPEEQVDALLAVIKPHSERFKSLPPDAQLDLSCAIYAYDDSQRVFYFSAEAVKELAKISAPISIAYYDLTNLSEETDGKSRKKRRK